MATEKKRVIREFRKLTKITSVRTGSRVEDIKKSFLDNLFCSIGRLSRSAGVNDLYMALALSVRDRVLKQGVHTLETYTKQDARVVAYLSAEFLPGPHLANNILNLGIMHQTQEAMASLGFNLDMLLEQEEEPGLGNGGLGRLASCYMDSLASLEIPAIGYGIRYEFGIFNQAIRDGWQVESSDKWLRYGNPWEIMRPEIVFNVPFGGHTENWIDSMGQPRVRWIPETVVRGVAYDTPILGYRVGTCNRLRLWKAEAVESFDFNAFNHGDYYRAVKDKIVSENITKVLYPNNEHFEGKELRLEQQFFFVTCSLQDMIRVHLRLKRPLDKFDTFWAVQLNDTHPAIAIPELMRLLVDEYLMDWDTAWDVTQKTFAYTNHTLLPEALEIWPVHLLGYLLPRHLEIIYEINHRFLRQVQARFPNDPSRLKRMSLIDENGERYVRMANLATVGSHHINGVSKLHSDILKSRVLSDFSEMSPRKFCNITNGVTPRRFVALSNPPLDQLLTDRIGEGWLTDLDKLRKIETFADNADFQRQWREVKNIAKCKLAMLIKQRTGVVVNPESLFDIQVKRIHEYKRQHLNVLHILTLYRQITQHPQMEIPSRTFIFGGKAAPGYFMAKLLIKLIHAVADLINNNPDVSNCLKVVFFPNYNIKNAQFVYPAADLSEQISLAGKEASGTGNMKFSLNGALTIGTLDGANVEIREEVGPDNFFLFGLTTQEAETLKDSGYKPRNFYEQNSILRDVIDFISSGALAGGDKELFRPLVDNLLESDPFLVLADYQSYIDSQRRVSTLWQDQKAWARTSILNVARMGKFSSDRSIRDYCRDVWQVQPMHVKKEAIEPCIQNRQAVG
ncbi:MAG: glycogen/starch/alpha-glucan phosphorylase [Sedimentisphaerales bacterium]|nr:glycogen/starch/alpha-glucan phosphorylase [Sedimentisphaerales bacterium]